MLNLLLSKSAYFIDAFEPFAKWITIGVLAFLLLLNAVMPFIDKARSGKTIRVSLAVLTVYALALGIFMLIFEISKKYDQAYLMDNYVNADVLKMVLIPLLITLAVALAFWIVSFCLRNKKSVGVKITKIVLGLITVACVITSLVLMAIYYSNNIVGDDYYTKDESKFSSLGLYIGGALLVVGLIVCALFIGRKNKSPWDSRTVAFAGICLALSFSLSFIKFEAAWLQGGSITLISFLPICLFSYVYGMKKGLIVGVVYGLLQAIQDPFIVHPAQFLLDYPIAFSSICMAGLLTDLDVLSKNPKLKFTLGVIFTSVARYIAHTISGVFAFGAYALYEGASNFLVYSAIYNTYVFIDIALVIIAGLVVLSSKAFIKELDKMNPSCQLQNQEEKN